MKISKATQCKFPKNFFNKNYTKLPICSHKRVTSVNQCFYSKPVTRRTPSLMKIGNVRSLKYITHKQVPLKVHCNKENEDPFEQSLLSESQLIQVNEVPSQFQKSSSNKVLKEPLRLAIKRRKIKNIPLSILNNQTTVLGPNNKLSRVSILKVKYSTTESTIPKKVTEENTKDEDEMYVTFGANGTHMWAKNQQL